MAKKLTVLIIEDHPFVLESYRSILELISSTNKLLDFKIDTATNCDTAYSKIKRAAKENKIDIIFLDIRIPPSADGKILSGEDLGIIINKLIPDSKIIIFTFLDDSFRIQNLLKNVNPDGLLIKSDITNDEIQKAILTVISNPPYYSKTILKLLRKHISSDFILDEIDRKLLYELSLGTRMKDLPKILFLTIAGIEKRKRHLKKIFNVKTPDDKSLLLKAKEKGFI